MTAEPRSTNPRDCKQESRNDRGAAPGVAPQSVENPSYPFGEFRL